MSTIPVIYAFGLFSCWTYCWTFRSTLNLARLPLKTRSATMEIREGLVVTPVSAAKFAGKLTHDSPTRAPCPIGVGVGFARVRFPPDPASHRTLSSDIQDREDQNSRSLVRGRASKPTASAHDRMWIHFRFAVLTKAVAQPDFSISAFAAGRRTIRFLGLGREPNELNWFLRRFSWPCGLGRPGYGELFPRSSCEQRRSVRTDRGLAEPQGAHIPKSTLLVEFRGGGPPGGAADSLIAAAVHFARPGRRCYGCRSAAGRRVPSESPLV